MFVLTGNQMKNIDRRAIETYHIPGIELMQRAGLAVFLELQKQSNWLNRDYIILCGKGNNGGDGFEVARLLWQAQCKITVVAMSEVGELRGDAQLAATALKQVGCPTIYFNDWERDKERDWDNTVIIDALLGTGFWGQIRSPYDVAIGWINEKRQEGACVVSIDIPSGLCSDNGAVKGPAVAADLTVTFCCEKYVHRFYPARRLCGKIVTADIGIPKKAVEEEGGRVRLFEEADARRIIPILQKDAHKGTSGKLLILGGSLGMAGAVVMNICSALRSGCGLVSTMVPCDIYPVVASQIIEGMVIPGDSTSEGRLSQDNIPAILEKAEKMDALLMGSGMGQCPDTKKIVRDIIIKSKKPLVVDADGINNLSGHIDILESCKSACVLTPHIGEMARLCGVTSAQVENDRIGMASHFAKEHGCYVVLKGPSTVTASPTGDCYINTTGNPGMATGGSGDVLAGIIGAFLARGIPPFEACAAAVYIHGLAADFAAEKLSQYGMIATDIIKWLPKTLKFYDCREC
jgi:NAD(P)H-hydrate epimerase